MRRRRLGSCRHLKHGRLRKRWRLSDEALPLHLMSLEQALPQIFHGRRCWWRRRSGQLRRCETRHLGHRQRRRAGRRRRRLNRRRLLHVVQQDRLCGRGIRDYRDVAGIDTRLPVRCSRERVRRLRRRSARLRLLHGVRIFRSNWRQSGWRKHSTQITTAKNNRAYRTSACTRGSECRKGVEKKGQLISRRSLAAAAG